MFFESLNSAPYDPIMALTRQCHLDERPEKMDLGIGVYRDEMGITPIFRAVKEAENHLLQAQNSKAYVGMQGHLGFNKAMSELVLGQQAMEQNPLTDRIRTVQTPGASGALRLLADLIRKTQPNATVWLSNPSYTNHEPIFRAAGLNVCYYPYFNVQTKQVDVELMLATLSALGTDDVVLLHGCCHNPTGADLDLQTWQQITELALMRGFLPLIDMAYQGFGVGLKEDAAGTRYLTERVPAFLLASSCSKNFGLYRERVGLAIFAGSSVQESERILSQLLSIARNSYTMPPDHGAAIVAHILSTPALNAVWQSELESINQQVRNTRKSLANVLRTHTQSAEFDYLNEHQGMFSMLGISQEVIAYLRQTHAIYMLENGRINLAGLATQDIERFARSLANAVRHQ